MKNNAWRRKESVKNLVLDSWNLASGTNYRPVLAEIALLLISSRGGFISKVLKKTPKLDVLQKNRNNTIVFLSHSTNILRLPSNFFSHH